MALTGYFAGVLSDMMIQRGISVTLTRKVMQVNFLHIPCFFVFLGIVVLITDHVQSYPLKRSVGENPLLK